MPKAKKEKKGFTDHDAKLIDDLRRALVATTVRLPSGEVFDGSTPASQVGFEKAAAKVVLERIKG